MSESASPQYVVRDPQGNIYGPADAAMLRDWVAQGRIVSGMHVAPAGTQDWLEASQHPALAGLLTPASAAGAIQPTVTPVTPQNPYGTPGTPANAPVNFQSPYPIVPQNPLARWAMISGICALFLGCLCGPLGLVAGVAAIILGAMGLNKIKTDPTLPGRGQAIAGIVLGILGIVLMVLAIIAFIIIEMQTPSP